MIHFTKKFYAMIFAICSISQIMQATDMRDEAGRTELMNYVIAAEKEIEYKKSELRTLWNTYFYLQATPINNIGLSGTTVYNFTTVRKIYTTDVDVAHYKKVEDEYNLFIEDIRNDIKSMVLHGADLQARDAFGKSISDYSSSHEIYYFLRDLGAPATLLQDQCIRVVYGLCGATALTIATVFLAVCYKAYYHK